LEKGTVRKIKKGNPMKTSEAMKNLIKQLEGYSEFIYADTSGYKTIGYGHLIKPSDPIIKEVLGFSNLPASTILVREIGEKIFNLDILEVEGQLNKRVKGLKQHQFDVMVDFIFNLGITRFDGSTMLKLIKQGRMSEVGEQLMRWVKGRDKSGAPVTVAGLLKRRDMNRAIFMAGIKPVKLTEGIHTLSVYTSASILLDNYVSDFKQETGINLDTLEA
jgi:lysozyme